MIELTQQEADALLALEKYYFEANVLKFPDLGGTLRLVLHSLDKREEFNLDITRGKISLAKNTFQTRARKAIVLVRLDILGPPHRNPNGEEVECPHIRYPMNLTELKIFMNYWTNLWIIAISLVNRRLKEGFSRDK